MVTMARSKKLSGPYESYSKNPVLSNANTTSYCEVVSAGPNDKILTVTKSKPLAIPICSMTETEIGKNPLSKLHRVLGRC